jgi:hypothetical protein
MKAWAIPEIVIVRIVIGGRRTLRFTGEEALIFCLKRLATDSNFHEDARFMFGRENSQWSRLWHWWIDHMYQNHIHLLEDYLPFFVPFFEKYANAISSKINEITKGTRLETDMPPGSMDIVGFIDCTIAEIPRIGGPLEPGVGADRYPPDEHTAFYQNWVRKCGQKHLGVLHPDGMFSDMQGSTTAVHHDQHVAQDTRINERMQLVQQGSVRIYALYGDRAFMNGRCITRPHMSHERLLAWQIRDNKIMGKVRIGIEWGFGSATKLFKFVANPDNFKIRKHHDARRYYRIAILVLNSRNCLYWSITSQYFKCIPPTLEEYFSV